MDLKEKDYDNGIDEALDRELQELPDDLSDEERRQLEETVRERVQRSKERLSGFGRRKRGS